MSNIKKHTDVVGSMEEFTANYEQGMYTAPWIVYVGNNVDGYSVVYSNDESRASSNVEPEFVESLVKRIEALETENVYCYEEEYDVLVTEGKAWITNLDGSRREVEFDNSKTYCIYEEDGPALPDEPEEPTEPEIIE